MLQSRITFFSSVLLLFAVAISCDTEDPFSIPPPDFSTVPEPFDTSNVDAVDLSDGVKAYIHDEGYGPFKIVARDQVNLFLTLRTESGEIIYSTFSSDRTDPLPISMAIADGADPGVHQSINQTAHNYTILLTYTPGFKEGLLGMREGEQRTIVVSPEKGYKNIPANIANESHKESTLIYDIRISNIGPKKSQ